MSRQTLPFALLIALLVLLALTLPFWLAAQPPDAVFAGFLLNPYDGHSYLAKMVQGWRGQWQFYLPFTADPGAGVYLFLPYLFLGHVARWTGLPLVWVFHLARLAAAIALLGALWRFYQRYLPQPGWSRWSFAIAAFGLGMGWLLLPAGRLASDFWVAETYPFLSAFVNPHFPLSLALLVWLLTPAEAANPGWREILPALPAGLLLSLLSPFGLVLAGLVLAAWWLVGVMMGRFAPADGETPAWRLNPFDLLRRPLIDGGLAWKVLAAGLGGAPFSLYYLWITRTHPQLAVWNAQNQTLTPAAWDVGLALSPVLLLALPGAWQLIRCRERRLAPLLAWAAVGLILIYMPFSLQRRFMMGLYVPLAGLAGYALASLSERRQKTARRLAVLALALPLPTTLLILNLATVALNTREPQVYLTPQEAQALDWLGANTDPQALVLASPQMGMFIPGRTGQRVIYGHPYETVHADTELEAVTAFYEERLPDPAGFLASRRVDYVFYGPRERALGSLPDGLALEAAFSDGDVTVYRVRAP